MKRLRQGEAIALTRTLDGPRDPAALLDRLSEGGARSDVALMERSVGPGLLMTAAAVRIECRGGRVDAVALSVNGRNLLPLIAPPQGDRSTILFPRCASHDPGERLLAPSPFDAVRRLTLGLRSLSPEQPFTVTAPGIVAYDHVDLLETLPEAAEDPLGFPDFVFWIAESLVILEPAGPARLVCTAFGSDDRHAAERAYFDAAERLGALAAACVEKLRGTRPAQAPRGGLPAEPDMDDQAYAGVVARMKDHIAAGEVYQIVPSRTFRTPCPDPLASYRLLREKEAAPYRFFLKTPDHLLFGASPETSVRVYDRHGSRKVEVKPIAGTRPRSATPDEDDRLEADMRLDGKELAEHMMLVDLARNDVARVSAPGTRRVERLMSVERYARVMHLVSTVTGTLRPGLDALHALVACLNVGTLTGAPKLRATELLRREERSKRGPYGGAVGWVTGAGLMDTAVVIRSALVKDGTAFVRVGAGVVHDSDPDAEAEETRRKASALLSVLQASGGAV